MPRGKTKKNITARQREILDLMKAQPEITAPEIAELLETSPGAIYQQISRLRAAGHLPKAAKSNGRRGRKLAPATLTQQAGNSASAAPTFDEMVPPTTASNGGLTIEEHLDQELGAVLSRIETVRHEQERLAAEDTELQGKRGRYEKAAAALSA